MKQIAIEWVRHEDLNPATYNPRSITPQMMDKLRKGIREFGIVDPLVINRDGTIIGGHQRLKAGLEEGYDEFPCIRLDLDKRREKALNLALNKLAGEWDYDKLGSMISEFESDPSFDIELTGFDAIEAVEITSLGDLNIVDSTALVGGPEGEDDASEESGDGEGADSGARPSGYSIVYTIVFDSEEQQKEWHAYLQALKTDFPDLETIAARIIEDIRTRAA